MLERLVNNSHLLDILERLRDNQYYMDETNGPVRAITDRIFDRYIAQIVDGYCCLDNLEDLWDN